MKGRWEDSQLGHLGSTQQLPREATAFPHLSNSTDPTLLIFKDKYHFSLSLKGIIASSHHILQIGFVFLLVVVFVWWLAWTVSRYCIPTVCSHWSPCSFFLSLIPVFYGLTSKWLPLGQPSLVVNSDRSRFMLKQLQPVKPPPFPGESVFGLKNTFKIHSVFKSALAFIFLCLKHHM